MKKITKPCQLKEGKYIFSEGIDYFKTDKTSIWGIGDKKTLDVLNKTKIKGRWLNLAAGDGRYNLNILKKADLVVASDIDESALSKLWYTTPSKYKRKLDIKKLNITRRFPFENNSFDGVFCTGALHLFPKEILIKIISEIDRVLKQKGRVIIDFATNIKRISADGKPVIFGNEPLYNLNEAKKILGKIFKDYKVKIYESEVVENFQKADPSYILNCKFIILIADKK